ncbi:MAG: tetratricopeptide repeat protein [Bacteroidota bacterium]|nr:tetratricopeptide repeat protein [Bacteroidota bacterium]
MKKVVMLMVLMAAFTIGYGQTSTRQTASNYLKHGDLAKALETINQCIQDPSTATDAKTWMIRGNIFLEISNSKDEKVKALDAEPMRNAMNSYKKAMEFDTKGDYKEDIFAKVNWQRNNYFNEAVEFYNKKDYRNAMNSFENAAHTMAIANVSDTLALFYAAACAGMSNNREKAKQYYVELLNAKYKSPALYMSLSDIYRQDKDSANALKIAREGQKLYPNDLKLFLAETNIYLTFNQTQKALQYLRYAIQKDSTNPTVYFALGTIYDNLSNDTTKPEELRASTFNNAINCYKNAIRLNSNYFEPNYNLGALYVNKAATINDIANKLPLDAEAQFKKLKNDADQYLGFAAPYLERASEIQPSDLNTLYSLKQIYARTNQQDKLKVIDEKIDNAQHKK